MEIPEIGIKQINIPEVHIPEIYNPLPILPVITNLEIDVVGCTYQHRDVKNTGNTQLLLDDPNGVFLTCGESVFPSFYPIDYRPDQIVITEDLPISNSTPPMPETDLPETRTPENKKKELIIPECPSRKEQKIGDYRNSKRIERVIGHKLSSDKLECITLYESVPFRETFIGTPEVLISTAAIGLVAGGSAALVPVIQGIAKSGIKQITKKLTKKKNDVK
ncbi:MAG: hypothetical protein CMF74_14010 [Maricaulis sp.]|nr:hypothetical protein [Maricaulis sp.]